MWRGCFVKRAYTRIYIYIEAGRISESVDGRAACYSRRTSRVSVENKRHVVYTSTDDPIEIARPFLRLNEWDLARKEGRMERRWCGSGSETMRWMRRKRNGQQGSIKEEGKRSRWVSLARWLRPRSLPDFSSLLLQTFAVDSMTPQRGVRNWLHPKLEKRRRVREEDTKEENYSPSTSIFPAKDASPLSQYLAHKVVTSSSSD